jgi:hypothetical protein
VLSLLKGGHVSSGLINLSINNQCSHYHNAGDVHCGGHSEIIKNNKVLFRQLTTSAIANMPLPKSAYYFMRAAGRLGRLQHEYCFRHHQWTRARNYGVVQIKHHSLEVKQSQRYSESQC